MLRENINDLSKYVEPDRVRREVYTDAQIFDLEMQRIHEKVWIYCGHETQVPKAGDYYTLQIGRQPMIMVRGANGKVNVLYNRCPHRGNMICGDRKGNTGEQMTRDFLKIYGLDYGKLSKVNFGSYNDSVEQLKDGHAQVFTLITTVPASSVMDLASARKIQVLDLTDLKLKELQKINKGYDKRIIKAGSYPGQDKDIQTIGTWTHLIMRCSTPEELAYKITKSLAQNTEQLGNVVAAVKGLTAKELAIDVGVPYHPGARKFYREAKVM